MTPLFCHSTKYDGSLHYRYEVTLIHQEPSLRVVYAGPGTVINGYRHTNFRGTEHNLGFLWPDRHYNVWVKWKPEWVPSCHYVNIALPATWDDQAVRFVDMDLDLIHGPGVAAPKLDDEDEFEDHRGRWSYPADLVDRCWAAVGEVREAIARRDWPFDAELYAWRPGKPLPMAGVKPNAAGGR